MMRWWVDRGVDGFRMDVINLISKDPALPDGAGPTGPALRVRRRGRRQRPAAARVPAEMNREVGLGDAAPAHRRRDAGRDDRAGPRRHRPGAPRARHGVHLRARRPRPAARRRRSGTCADLPLPVLKANLAALAGRASPTSAGTRSTGTTTISRGPSPGSATTARAPGRLGEDARHGAAPAPGHAVRLPGRRARHDQRLLHRASSEYRDIESLNYHAEALSRGVDAEEVLHVARR